MSALQPGQVMARRFTLQRCLGRGATSETWLAKDLTTQADVALKISTDPTRDALLNREWQVSIRLVHPHIVRVFEFNEDVPASYSQQFIDGVSLSSFAGQPAEAILPALASIADALRYAHGKDIVHCDIKASNILVDRQGTAYLIDFGVAAHGEDDVGGGSLIAQSPARLKGDAPTAADDVFALGGLFYELLSGRSPYSASNMAEDICERVPPSLYSLDDLDISPPISALVADMLSKNASDRPSISAVLDRLEQLDIRPGLVPKQSANRVFDTTPSSPIQPARIQPTRKHTAQVPLAADTNSTGGVSPRLLGIGLLVLIGLLGSVIFLLPSAVQDPATVPTPSVETDDSGAEGTESSTGKPIDNPVAGVADSQPGNLREQRAATEEVLGELLAKLETLEERAVERWGGLDYARAKATYEAGDAAYLQRDYRAAATQYAAAIEQVDPLLERVDEVFDAAMASGQQALNSANAADAVSAYELAVAVSENSTAARRGLERARNLSDVLELVNQGLQQERDLELAAARQSFANAVELDPEWEDAVAGLSRVEAALEESSFAARMSEGIQALTSGDLLTARAAFRMADQMRPGAPEPADGLLQVQQELRLQAIASLERDAATQKDAEQWELAAATYAEILEIDSTLQFAKDGAQRAANMVDLYARIDTYISDPDQLSNPTVTQRAAQLMIDMTRMPEIGPRLGAQRDELSRLLKRASTDITVQLVSDEQTTVSIYKVGRLGTFRQREIELRPGSYVAVGIRPGFRDVRVEFRVAPELDMEPVIVRCEEPI